MVFAEIDEDDFVYLLDSSIKQFTAKNSHVQPQKTLVDNIDDIYKIKFTSLAKNVVQVIVLNTVSPEVIIYKHKKALVYWIHKSESNELKDFVSKITPNYTDIKFDCDNSMTSIRCNIIKYIRVDVFKIASTCTPKKLCKNILGRRNKK